MTELIDRSRTIHDARPVLVTGTDLGVLEEHAAEAVLLRRVDPGQVSGLVGDLRILIVDGWWTRRHEALLRDLSPGTLLLRRVPSFTPAVVGTRASIDGLADVLHLLENGSMQNAPIDFVVGAVYRCFWAHPGVDVELIEVPRA